MGPNNAHCLGADGTVFPFSATYAYVRRRKTDLPLLKKIEESESPESELDY